LGLAEKGLHAASPETFATLQKSLELFLARAESGLIKPAAKVAFGLQDAAHWLERHPDTADTLGKATALGVAGGATVLALGAFTRAVQAAAVAAGFAANMFRASATTSAAANAASRAGMGISPAENVLGGGAAGAVTRGGRLARVAGRFGPLAAVAGGVLDTVDFWDKSQNDPAQALWKGLGKLTPDVPTYSDIYGVSDFSEDAAWWINRNFFGKTREDRKNYEAARDAALQSVNPFKAGGFLERNLGFSPNPLAWIGLADTADDVKKREIAKKFAEGHKIEPPSNVAPAFMPIEDVYKSVAMSVMSTTPLDAEINQARQENFGKLVEEVQKSNGYLAQLADKPAALPARP
jgi:hypothetical protein